MSDREIAGLVLYGIFLTGMYFLYSDYIKKTEARSNKTSDDIAVIIAKLEGLATTQQKAKGSAK